MDAWFIRIYVKQVESDPYFALLLLSMNSDVFKKKKKKADWYMLHSKLISSRKKGTRPRYLIDEELGGFFLPLNVLNLAKVILKFFK